MRSIRAYLLTRLLGGTVLVLLAAGVAAYFVVARSLQAEFDLNLANRVQNLASLLFQVKDHVEFEFSDQLMPEYERADSPDYFELRFEDGRLLERSNSLLGRDLLVPDAITPEPSYWDAPLPDGREGRYVAQRIEVHHVYPEEGPDRPEAALVRVVIGRGREELAAVHATVLGTCAAVCLVLIALIATVSWIAIDRGLRPARRLAAMLDAIEVDRLPRTLEAGELPRELTPMAGKIDALIQRVDAALQRERRTTADMAHELRTPISELLTVSEVALRDGRDVLATRRALGTVRDVAWRMAGSLSTLLKLARLEMGAETIERESVDLGGIVREFLRSLSAVGRERGLRVENCIEAGECVEGDRDVLWIIVSNLLSNALYHSPPHGTVRCRLERAAEGWCLVVENETLEIRPEDMAFLCEPFWRKDRARTDSHRSGLGLTLSRALADRTGLDLRFELEDQTFRAALARHSSGEARWDPASERPARVPSRLERAG